MMKIVVTTMMILIFNGCTFLSPNFSNKNKVHLEDKEWSPINDENMKGMIE